jgi:ferredoxin
MSVAGEAARPATRFGEGRLSYVIAAPCVADYACVEVCPVACISPGPDDPRFDTAVQLYIDPQACIECGACAEVCPVSAIFAHSMLPAKWRHYEQINRQYFASAEPTG